MCDDLERRLKRAAEAANWPNVLHRCAWCNHLFDEHGAYGNVLAFDPEAIATDGMCPACAARALSQIAARRRSRKPLAA